MSTDHLTPTTATWLVFALLGLFFAILNLQSSRHDVRATILVKNYRRPTRLLIATGAVHRNWIKLLVFAWWVFLGVLFGFFDPPEVVGLGAVLGLIGTVLGMAYVGYHEGNERRVLAELLADDIADDVLTDHDATVDLAEDRTRLRELNQDLNQQHDADIAQATVRAADRMGRAMQQTAENTQRIAENTDKAD